MRTLPPRETAWRKVSQNGRAVAAFEGAEAQQKIVDAAVRLSALEVPGLFAGGEDAGAPRRHAGLQHFNDLPGDLRMDGSGSEIGGNGFRVSGCCSGRPARDGLEPLTRFWFFGSVFMLFVSAV